MRSRIIIYYICTLYIANIRAFYILNAHSRCENKRIVKRCMRCATLMPMKSNTKWEKLRRDEEVLLALEKTKWKIVDWWQEMDMISMCNLIRNTRCGDDERIVGKAHDRNGANRNCNVHICHSNVSITYQFNRCASHEHSIEWNRCAQQCSNRICFPTSFPMERMCDNWHELVNASANECNI